MPLGSSDPLPAWHRMVRKLLRTIHPKWNPRHPGRRRKKPPPPEAPINDAEDDADDDHGDHDDEHFDV